MNKTFEQLEQLILYRKLLDDPVISLCRKIGTNDVPEKDQVSWYCEACYRLFAYYDTMPVLKNLWQNYFLGKIIADENPFALVCEREEANNISPSLLEAGQHDLTILYQLISFDWIALGQSLKLSAESWFQSPQIDGAGDVNPVYASALSSLVLKLADSGQLLPAFVSFYRQFACGNIAVYRAFRWDGNLVGIDCPDPVRMENLIGYENQKQALRKNTEAFLARRGGNHVLLFGDKGTGKSSSVKALLHEYADDNLRMIELERQQLADLNRIIDLLRRRSGSYIIFIDDLSFEDFEVEYKYLKSHIEGSLQAPAENVRLYVTSNRRHLIRENWSDRQHQDDVHRREAQQEKLSFADRFGLTLTYSSPLQEEYLKMVREMAIQEGLAINEEILDRMAIQWELRYHGRSGRTARQFINDLKSRG